MTTKGKWHYIPSHFTTKEPNSSPEGIPLYWDFITTNHGNCVAFLPPKATDVITVLRYLNLKVSTVKWEIVKEEMYCTAAESLKKKADKQTAKDLVALYTTARNSKGQLADLQGQLDGHNRDAKEYMSYLTSIYEKIEKVNRTLSLLDNNNGEAQFKKELREILRLEKVESVHMKDSRLIVRTKPLICTSSKDKVVFGPFDMIINIPSGTLVNMKNTTPINYMGIRHHPHIYQTQGDYICWGNFGAQVADLQARREIPMLIALVIDWVESFKPGRGGDYTNIYNEFKLRHNAAKENKEIAIA